MLDFANMSKRELKEYYQWFHNILPARIQELAEAVRSTPGFESWCPDETPDSLDVLGNWLAAQAETRQRTKDEILKIQGKLTFPIEISNRELTNRTYSLAVDAGMYISMVFLKNHPSLQWKHFLSGRRNANYGQPVLVGFGVVPFNPIRITVVLMRKFVNNKCSVDELRSIYDYWSKKVPFE